VAEDSVPFVTSLNPHPGSGQATGNPAKVKSNIFIVFPYMQQQLTYLNDFL
jgi:hypothetical protein